MKAVWAKQYAHRAQLTPEAHLEPDGEATSTERNGTTAASDGVDSARDSTPPSTAGSQSAAERWCAARPRPSAVTVTCRCRSRP